MSRRSYLCGSETSRTISWVPFSSKGKSVYHLCHPRCYTSVCSTSPHHPQPAMLHLATYATFSGDSQGKFFFLSPPTWGLNFIVNTANLLYNFVWPRGSSLFILVAVPTPGPNMKLALFSALVILLLLSLLPLCCVVHHQLCHLI